MRYLWIIDNRHVGNKISAKTHKDIATLYRDDFIETILSNERESSSAEDFKTYSVVPQTVLDGPTTYM